VDRTELATLLPSQRDALLRYATTITRDPATAEDMVQETLLRALERSDSLSDSGALRSWLFRILHNLVVDHYRGLREEPSDEIAHEVEQRWREDAYTVDAAAVATRTETRQELQDALLRLPVTYRTVVVLHDAEGWTSPEIAESLQLGVPAVKQRLRRGRMMLVTALASGHERRVATMGVPLRCWDARRHVSAYLDAELEPPMARAVEQHLASCPTCPPLYASLVSARDALAGLSALRDPDSVVPLELATRIRER
jgi:RNA polymerase sigma-70 factor (ECF subfamily)